MIISASRRTDIPGFYSQWLINRLKAGFAYVPNPRNPNRLSQVPLSPEGVDCIVFWTKNPKPMLDKLDTIDAMGYAYYFQFTLTPYDRQIEKGLPPKALVLDTFKELSDRIGKHRVVWRYDPVIVNAEMPAAYHLDAFEKMCRVLQGYTQQCIFSYLDLYARAGKGIKGIADLEVDAMDMERIAKGFSQIAKAHGLSLATCSEQADLSQYGIGHASCIDPDRIAAIIGCPIRGKKDANQRPACGCVESVDIGTYDSCLHGCVYCYATVSENRTNNQFQLHDPQSPMLIGHPKGDEIITRRDAKSLKDAQISLL